MGRHSFPQALRLRGWGRPGSGGHRGPSTSLSPQRHFTVQPGNPHQGLPPYWEHLPPYWEHLPISSLRHPLLPPGSTGQLLSAPSSQRAGPLEASLGGQPALGLSSTAGLRVELETRHPTCPSGPHRLARDTRPVSPRAPSLELSSWSGPSFTGQHLQGGPAGGGGGARHPCTDPKAIAWRA